MNNIFNIYLIFFKISFSISINLMEYIKTNIVLKQNPANNK